MRDPLHIAILRLIVRLYPAEFRLRHGDDIVASARASWRATRGARATLVVLDAIVTLGRLWSSRAFEATVGGVARRAAGMFASDAALALRVVRRRPLQGTAIVITLALALGANAAIYTVAHEILLDRVPYDSPERIMQVTSPPVVLRLAPTGGFTWGIDKVLTDHPGVEAAAIYYEDAGANLVTGVEASRVRITGLGVVLRRAGRAHAARQRAGPGVQ